MKKVMLGGVALITLGFVGAAVAADMPLKAPAPVVVNTWTGFYAGVDFGGINGSQRVSPSTRARERGRRRYLRSPMNSTNHWGAMGGVHAGYNWAVTPSWLVGVEGDWNKTNLGTMTPCRGRVFADAGGIGNAGRHSGTPLVRRDDVRQPELDCDGARASRLHLGQHAALRHRRCRLWTAGAGGGAGGCWTVQLAARLHRNLFELHQLRLGGGGGIEVMATANWLVRIEYLHYRSAREPRTRLRARCAMPAPSAGPGNFNWGSTNYDVVRAGLATSSDLQA